MSTAGKQTIGAILPHFERWVDRKRGELNFHLVQVLTGHGCFGEYLHRVAGREESPRCHGCGAAVDDVRHTLEVCLAWGPQRHNLVAIVGNDLSLPTIISTMLDSERSWEAMASFCKSVMAQKEAAERERENDPSAPNIRRRRAGRARRRYAHLLPPP